MCSCICVFPMAMRQQTRNSVDGGGQAWQISFLRCFHLTLFIFLMRSSTRNKLYSLNERNSCCYSKRISNVLRTIYPFGYHNIITFSTIPIKSKIMSEYLKIGYNLVDFMF